MPSHQQNRAFGLNGTAVHVFVCHPSDQKPLADRLAARLAAAGHTVFFDKTSLGAGEGFDTRIREEVERADLFVFFVTPTAVTKGRYTLTELEYARALRPDPVGFLLAVEVEPTPPSDLPAYVAAANLLQTDGDLVAAVIAKVDRAAAGHEGAGAGGGGTRLLLWICAAFAVIAVVIFGIVEATKQPPKESAVPSGPPEEPEQPLCSLSARVGDDLDGGSLRVTGNGESADYLVLSEGRVWLDVLPAQLPEWTLTALDGGGHGVGSAPLIGCPQEWRTVELDTGARLEVGPRE